MPCSITSHSEKLARRACMCNLLLWIGLLFSIPSTYSFEYWCVVVLGVAVVIVSTPILYWLIERIYRRYLAKTWLQEVHYDLHQP